MPASRSGAHTSRKPTLYHRSERGARMDPLLKIYQAYGAAMSPSDQPSEALLTSAGTSAPTDSPSSKGEPVFTQTSADSDSNPDGEALEVPREEKSTPSPVVSCYIARQLFYADTVTIQTVFTDNIEEDCIDELIFRVFSMTTLSHFLDEVERYRGLDNESCTFFHYGRLVTRSFRGPVAVYFFPTRMVRLEACVIGGRCIGNQRRFLKAQDYRKGKFF
ncbi:hypothetical protein ABW21_db0207890 [Orbilia brochopaga]|nr:hypothetical protein ABW21_db0207890 [Drechslerella brochopaga]